MAHCQLAASFEKVGFHVDIEEDEEALVAPFEALPDDLLPRILLETGGAWRVATAHPEQASSGEAACAVWSVCRAWRDVAWGDPAFPSLLVDAMTSLCEDGTNGALLRACTPRRGEGFGCSRGPPPHHHAMVTNLPDLVQRLARQEGIRTDYEGGWVLEKAAQGGDEGVVRVLLEELFMEGEGGAHEAAMTAAILKGHVGVVRMLLEWFQKKHQGAASGEGEGGETVLDRLLAEMSYGLDLAAGAGKDSVVKLLLTWPREGEGEGGAGGGGMGILRADAGNGRALVSAAQGGHEGVVRMLLQWPGGHAPFADCREGEALVRAAQGGHLAVVRLLLSWPHHAPRPDCIDGQALVEAAGQGHLDVARLLLQWPGGHAPRADCQNGHALCLAAREGQESMVRMLLQWPGGGAPRADCQNGQALCLAAQAGHESLARMLLQWPGGSAPRADCSNGRALIWAAERGHEGVVRMLLTWPKFPPRADVQDKAARKAAVARGHLGVLKILASKGG